VRANARAAECAAASFRRRWRRCVLADPEIGQEDCLRAARACGGAGEHSCDKLLAAVVDWAKVKVALCTYAWSRLGERGLAKGAPGRHQIQMKETYLIDLKRSEEELLALMSHKHRQYIRKAERDGVSVGRVTTIISGRCTRFLGDR